MTPREVLLAAAALLEPEGAWTQELYARDGKGEKIDYRAPQAICWCAIGGLGRAAGHLDHPGAQLAKLALCAKVLGIAPDLGPLTMAEDFDTNEVITAWNDNQKRTQAEVVAMLRAAAEGTP